MFYVAIFLFNDHFSLFVSENKGDFPTHIFYLMVETLHGLHVMCKIIIKKNDKETVFMKGVESECSVIHARTYNILALQFRDIFIRNYCVDAKSFRSRNNLLRAIFFLCRHTEEKV